MINIALIDIVHKSVKTTIDTTMVYTYYVCRAIFR